MGTVNSRQLFKTGFHHNNKLIRLTDQQLDSLKGVLLEMLADFITVMNQYQLNYSLSGGSVLGAVRHHGFIPWDDDVDLNMPRRDYEKLLDIFQQELGEKYILCSPERTREHGILCAQIKKKGTLYRSFNELTKPVEECGICMDIFVMENTFDNGLLRKLHGALCLGFGYLSTCRKTYQDMPSLLLYLDQNTKLKKAFQKKSRIGGLFRWLSLDSITRMAVSFYSLCKNNKSRYVTIPSGRGHYFGEMQRRADLCEMVAVPFETLTVNIPKGSGKYLKRLYGADYMQLPPAEKRETHPLMEFDLGRS